MESATQGWTLGRLAELLGAELHGPADMRVLRLATADSDDPQGIAFCESPEYLARAESSAIGALILPRDLSCDSKPFLAVSDSRAAFGELLALASRPLPIEPGIHPAAIVSPDATVDTTACVGAYSVIERGAVIGPRARVYPFAYVGENCTLAEDCALYPHAVLYQDVRLGARSVIHAGAVIGADGFGYGWDGKKRIKVPHVGSVEIGEDVEIGALTAVDRATVGETRIGKGTKIDNLVQIAHNVRVGEHGVIAAQSAVSGSSTVGDRVMMGGQTAVADHAKLGDDIALAARAATSQDILEPGAYFGAPAKPMPESMKAHLLIQKLPDIMSRLRLLEKRLAEIEREKD